MVRLADLGKCEVGEKRWPAVGLVGVGVGGLVGEGGEI